MPKFPTFPTLYDEVHQINISKLKEWGYLESGNHIGTLQWSRNGRQIGSISFRSGCHPEPEYIELDYLYRNQPRKYKVYFDFITSNLGKGKLWYFVCPQTLKRCRILYSVGGYFLHREAFSRVYYESQIRSKYMRFLDKNFGSYFKLDQIYRELHRKYFKSFYAGKPTKRYKKLMSQLIEANKYTAEDIERLMIFGRI